MALCMALGMTPLDVLLHAMGRQGDLSSGARQMFGHFSSRALRIVSGSSSVGSQPVHAVGLALACRVTGERDVVTTTFFGEGATAEGAWHEAMTFAGIHQLPVIFVCENNGYAISVPQARELPVPDVAAKAAGYGMPGVIVDGNDLFAVFAAAREAAERARAGGGPTLLECKTYRLRPHSNADDDRKYRSAEEVTQWRARDPILRLESYLLTHGIASREELDEMRRAARAEVDEATTRADGTPQPPPESIYDHLYAEQ
jgi:2-oxoisovalerate dehydrogenase E1 component alpha subunit